MLEELRSLDNPGEKKDIIFFLRNIVGNKTLLIDDLRVLCSHAPGGYQLRCDSIINYCKSFGWITIDDKTQVAMCLSRNYESVDKFNYTLVTMTIERLFDEASSHQTCSNTMFTRMPYDLGMNGCHWCIQQYVMF